MTGIEILMGIMALAFCYLAVSIGALVAAVFLLLDQLSAPIVVIQTTGTSHADKPDTDGIWKAVQELAETRERQRREPEGDAAHLP